MGKSIEEIWKNCHTDEDLIAPKYDRHYAKKSKLITEKIRKIQDFDNNSAIVIAFVSLIGFAFTRWLYLGIYLFSLFIILYLFNSRVLKRFSSIDANLNTYQFLIEYRNIAEKLFSLYSKLMTYVLPIILVPMYWLFVREFDVYEKIIEKLGVTNVVILVVVSLFAFAALGYWAYALSVKIMYGKLLSKLDTLILEIENKEPTDEYNEHCFYKRWLLWGIIGLSIVFGIGYIVGYLIAYFE